MAPEVLVVSLMSPLAGGAYGVFKVFFDEVSHLRSFFYRKWGIDLTQILLFIVFVSTVKETIESFVAKISKKLESYLLIST